MRKTLVIGYGNVDRQDDGVAFEVVNALRQRLGQPPLAEGDTGIEQLGSPIDSIFLLQLTPELTDVAAGYDRLFLVDAHVHPDRPELVAVPVEAGFATAPFTHHMTPATFRSLLEMLHGRAPETWVVSIRGRRFDFARGLSSATAAQVKPAVSAILDTD